MHFKLSKVVIYFLLVAGSLVFSFPFVWMASTSVKVDRELFTEDIRIKPLTPSAAKVSPYVDRQYYQELPGTREHQEKLLPGLIKLAQASGRALPEGLDAETAWEQVGRGLYLKLSRVLPSSVWGWG